MPSPLSKFMPYAHLLDQENCSPQLVKTQSLVSVDDKRTILAALGGDDGVFTLLIQTTFKRTADFIRANHLNSYDTTNYARVLDFIRNGSDTRPAGDAVTHHDPRPTQDSQRPTETASSKPAASLKGRPRGDGRKVRVTKES